MHLLRKDYRRTQHELKFNKHAALREKKNLIFSFSTLVLALTLAPF